MGFATASARVNHFKETLLMCIPWNSPIEREFMHSFALFRPVLDIHIQKNLFAKRLMRFQ
jgi:hypothetical protein